MTSSVDTVPVPTIPPQAGGEDALLSAELEWDPEDGCIYGVGDGDREGFPLVFPAGYAALANRHAIVDETGFVVAAEGDRVDPGGGFHEIVDGSVEGFGVLAVPCPDGPVYLVQHPIEPANG